MTAKEKKRRLGKDTSTVRFKTSGHKKHLRLALFFLLSVVGIGVIGFIVIEGWGFLDALYMTILTISTVGYQEVYPLSPHGKIFAVLLIITGVGTVAFAVRTAGNIMLENRLKAAFGRRVMKSIQRLRDHYIICGFGRMGRVICQELQEMGYPFVVVDNGADETEELERLGYLYIRGDATADDVLVDAGIDRAKGVVCVVTNDSENVFIALTARGLNPKLNIVSRAASPESVQKLIRAGANRVVSPYYLGGFRIAQSLLRPTVQDFLETIVHDKTMELRLEEVEIFLGSPLDGVNVASSGLRKDLNVIVLAVKGATGAMMFNPSFETELKAGDTIVVLGHRPDLEKLKTIAQKT
ncbi:potassium channel protein [bacterium]|nr:MAG: potassium channel protein [bacterium]